MTLTKTRNLLVPFIVIVSIVFIYQTHRTFFAVDVKHDRNHYHHPNLEAKPPTNIASDQILDNLLRSQAKCRDDFPDLYDSIDKSVSHFENHPIQRSNLEEAFKRDEGGLTWVVIRNNQLFVRSRHGGFQSRVQAVLADLHRAIITSPERLPDIEFLFNTADSAPSEKYTPVFGFSRGLSERAFLLADFGYWAWPEPLVNGFTEFRNKVDRVEEEVPWMKKKEQLFWRGNARMNPERERLIHISEQYNETWGNVRDIDWGNLKDDDRYDMADHCRFKFLSHVEGATYSARLKYLQHCNSVIVTHEQKWTTHLSHLLKTEGDEQNIVVVGSDFSAVESVMKDLMLDEWKAREIARNSQETFGKRYGRLDATVCYWRQVIFAYHSVMTPEFQKSVSSAYDRDGAKDYESVMLMGRTEWGVI